jgi:hypothetical protein
VILAVGRVNFVRRRAGDHHPTPAEVENTLRPMRRAPGDEPG